MDLFDPVRGVFFYLSPLYFFFFLPFLFFFFFITNFSFLPVSFFKYMTEKMGGAEGTKLDVDFVDMERVSVYIFVSWRDFNSRKSYQNQSSIFMGENL